MRTEILKVNGMTCGGCITTITKALKTVHGVGNVDVSLSSGAATVQFDERLTSVEQLEMAVQQAGYGVAGVKPTQISKGKGCCCS